MKTLASILALGTAAALAAGGPPDLDSSYFHPAASLFIRGDSPAASNLVATGLSLYPDNGKLKRLKELIEQQQEQQEQNNQDQQEQQDPQNQPQNQPQDQPQDQPPDPRQDPPEGDPQGDDQPPPEPQSAERMSPDEAERLLDAMRQDEENKRLQLHPVRGAPVPVDKDW